MKFIKSLFLFTLLIYIPITADYISAVVMLKLQTDSALSKKLKDIFEKNKDILSQDLTLSNVDQKNYHMTVISINLDTNKFIDKIKKKLESIAIEEFKNAFTEKKDVSLKFKHIQIFEKFIVTIFDNSLILQEIIQNIEQRLRNEIDISINMYHNYATFIPHISLAKISTFTNPNSTKIGAIINPDLKEPLFFTYNEKNSHEFKIESNAYIIKKSIPKVNPVIKLDYNLVNLTISLSILGK